MTPKSNAERSSNGNGEGSAQAGGAEQSQRHSYPEVGGLNRQQTLDVLRRIRDDQTADREALERVFTNLNQEGHDNQAALRRAQKTFDDIEKNAQRKVSAIQVILNKILFIKRISLNAVRLMSPEIEVDFRECHESFEDMERGTQHMLDAAKHTIKLMGLLKQCQPLLPKQT